MTKFAARVEACAAFYFAASLDVSAISRKRVNILTADFRSHPLRELRKQITRLERGNSEGCIERVLPVHDTRRHITLSRATCHSLLRRHSGTGTSMPIIRLIRTSRARVHRRSSPASSASSVFLMEIFAALSPVVSLPSRFSMEFSFFFSFLKIPTVADGGC